MRQTNAPVSKLRIVSLGGVDEIGKNMTVFEYEDDIVVVDCGSIFPKEDMLGIDLVIPDVSYLVAKKKNVRAYLLTHGHEDHIGATPYILKQVPAPLYGTKLTLALVDLKLEGIPRSRNPDAGGFAAGRGAHRQILSRRSSFM